MPILLDKALTLLAMPLGTAVGVGLLALAALALGRRRTAAVSIVFATVWLWIWSIPATGDALLGSLTRHYPFRNAEALPSADAIVVLGTVNPNPIDPAHPDLDGSSDRAWHAARLYLAGKAPLVIVSAGNVWGTSNKGSTAGATRVLLKALGVPDSAIVIEDRSRNTRQNALFTAELAGSRGIGKVLLATSVWHMPRAEAAFRRVGLEVIPASTDYRFAGDGYRPAKPWLLRILPDIGALSRSTRAFREHLGLLVYRLRGWA